MTAEVVSLVQPAHRIHPISRTLRPRIDGLLVVPHPEAVAAFGEEMEFAGDFVLLVFEIEHGSRCGILAVVVGTSEKHGWRIARHGEAFFQLGRLFIVHKTAAVDHDAKIWQLGLCQTITRDMSQQISTRAETEQADTLRIEAPVLGMLADQGDGFGGILNRFFMRSGLIAGRSSIFEQDAGDAEGVQPFADLRAFMNGGEKDVASAGSDDDGGAVRLFRAIHGDRWFVNVGDRAFAGLGADEVLGGLGMRLHFPRRAVRPELELDGFGGTEGQRGEEEEQRFHG